MHDLHSQFSPLTNRINQPYSDAAELLTKDTSVVWGLLIDRDQ